MQPKFTLSDADVRSIVSDARITQDPERLRSHIYRMVNLRKEMAAALISVSLSRNEMAKVSKSAVQVLDEDRNTGILRLLDNKGLIKASRQKLKDQMQANLELVNELNTLRSAVSAASNNDVEADLRRTIATIKRDIEQYRSAVAELTHDLERSKEENASLRALTHEPSVQPAVVEVVDTTRITELEGVIADLNDQLAKANETLALLSAKAEAAQQATPVAAQAQPPAGTADMISKMQTLFNEQLAVVLSQNSSLNDELQHYKEEAQSALASISALEARKDLDAQALKDLREAAEIATAEISSLQETVQAQTQELQTVRRDLETARLELDRANSSNQMLSSDLAAAKGVIAQQENAVRSLEERNKSLSYATEENARKAEEAEAQVLTLRDSIRQYIDQLSQLDNKLVAVTADWEAREQQMIGEKQTLESKVQQQDSAIKGLETTNDSLLRTVNILENRSSRLLRVKQTLEDSLKTLRMESFRNKELAKDASYEAHQARMEQKALLEKTQEQGSSIDKLSHQLQTASKVIRLEGPASRSTAILAPHETQLEESGAGEIQRNDVSPSN
jgi:chromosome segregation ATPase